MSLGHILSFRDAVVHLGHILQYSLDDSEDLNRVASDIFRNSNYLLGFCGIEHQVSFRMFIVIYRNGEDTVGHAWKDTIATGKTTSEFNVLDKNEIRVDTDFSRSPDSEAARSTAND